jgi:hypothetical protein
MGGAAPEVDGVDLDMAQEYVDAMESPVTLLKRPAPSLTGGLVCGPKTPCRAEAGMRVSHKQFGLGTVKGVMPRAKTFNIDVDFDKVGNRLIVAHMAILEQA